MPNGDVGAALRELAEDIRTAVYVAEVEVEGPAYKEIADVVRTPIGTVSSGLHRVRPQLCELLYERGGAPARASWTSADRSSLC